MDASAAVAAEMEAVVGDEEVVSVVEVLAVEVSVAGVVLQGDHLDRPRVNTDHDEEEGLLPFMFAASIFSSSMKNSNIAWILLCFHQEVYCMI